jgi:hypothetical protein
MGIALEPPGNAGGVGQGDAGGVGRGSLSFRNH